MGYGINNLEARAIREHWTRVLQRGELAIRERLARGPVARTGAAALGAGLLDGAAFDPGAEAALDVTLPVVSPFAELSIADRVLQPSRPADRTFLIALGIVLVLHVGALVGTIRLGDTVPELSDRDRQGQADTSSSIAVELVEAPDAKSQSKTAQMGEVIPPAPPPVEPLTEPTPPQPEQQPQELQKPQEQQAKQEPKPETAKPEKPAGAVPEPAVEYALEAKDTTITERANPNASQAQEAREEKEAREARDPSKPSPPPVVTAQVLGAAPKGRQSAYSKEVLTTLAKSKPQLWMRLAEVRVTFFVSPTGEPTQIKLLQSSNDGVFDDVVMNWIKRAKFQPPPPGAKPDELAYLIHYSVN